MARWFKSDRPLDSEHIDMGACAARVRPVRYGGWEWSTWIGRPGMRVLHQQGELASKTTAKRKAAALCKRLASR